MKYLKTEQLQKCFINSPPYVKLSIGALLKFWSVATGEKHACMHSEHHACISCV
jgi:hypothetical protein